MGQGNYKSRTAAILVLKTGTKLTIVLPTKVFFVMLCCPIWLKAYSMKTIRRKLCEVYRINGNMLKSIISMISNEAALILLKIMLIYTLRRKGKERTCKMAVTMEKRFNRKFIISLGL